MLSAEAAVCTECGIVHMEGSPGPADVETCGACGGALAEVEVDDLVGL